MAAVLIRQLQQAASVYEASTYIMYMVETTGHVTRVRAFGVVRPPYLGKASKQ